MSYFCLILGLVITENVVRPIRVLNHAAREVERKDELGDLSRVFNNMAASLKHTATRRRQLIADSANKLCTPVSLIQARIEIMEGDGPGIAVENRERVFLSLTSEPVSPEAGIPEAPVLDFQFAARLPGVMAGTLRPEARS